MTALLSLANVESAYGAVKAIRGVSLEVHKGAIVTVLGANGAGKTTILKTISGVIRPQKGSVTFIGENITDLPPAAIVRRGIAHAPEGREVFALLSVHENLLMGGYTRADRDELARDIEVAYGHFPILKERAQQEAGKLSGGQQQMLSISRALMSRPELLLLDEPSLGLSPLLTSELFDIVQRINRERGTTILLVEQNARLALEVADHGYVLEVGRVVMDDRCAVLRSKPDIQEFYLGAKEEGVRGERRWKKKKAMAMNGSAIARRTNLPGDTIPRKFCLAVQQRGPAVALRQKHKGVWQEMSWQGLGERARHIALGLVSLGFSVADVAAVLANTRWEWSACDYGILLAGGVSCGIYPTDAASQVQFLCADSATRFIFVEDD